MPETLHRLGLGTWQNSDLDQCRTSVGTALEVGYRHIDTAQMYHNETAVGEAIAEADVDRESVFVATKVHQDNLAYQDVLDSTTESLERLGLSYLDLLYIHWPIGTYDPSETLRAFDDLRDDGVIDRVGVSNFEPTHIREAREHLDAPIFANQIEMHPLLPQQELRAVAAEDDHWIVAYSPLARGRAFSDPTVREVSKEAGITPAQTCLAWLLSKDHVAAIPKATGRDHIEENWAARDVELTEDQLTRIDEIENRYREVDFRMAPWK